jgi:hypothetical protein
MNSRQRAKRLIKQYFHLLAKESGVYWDSDNDSELDELVDCLIDASIEEMQSQEEYKIRRKWI